MNRWIMAGLALGGGLAYMACTQEHPPDGIAAGVRPIRGLDIAGNARRVPEGYIISGMVTEDAIPIMRYEGIALVLSAVSVPSSVVRAAQRAGIRWVPVPLGATFRHADLIRNVTRGMDPRDTMVHCLHGADRSGAILAYLLSVRHGYTPAQSLWSVLAPTRVDIEGLNLVLVEMDDCDQRGYGDGRIGIYSPAAIGKSGGLKTRTDSYRQLARTTYRAILAAGVSSR